MLFCISHTVFAAEGADLVADINNATKNASGLPSQFVQINDTLYYTAHNKTTGTELWAFDSSTQIESLVADILPGSNSSEISALTVLNGKLYFSAQDASNGFELWQHDPGSNSTVMVTDINAGQESSSPTGLTVLNGQLYFSARDNSAGNELWRHDPGSNSTVMVADINPGQENSSPAELAVLSGKLYFSAQDASNGFELWQHDPGSNSTVMVADINSGQESSSPKKLTVLNGQLYFVAKDNSTGQELWRHDPGSNTTTQVADIRPGDIDAIRLSYAASSFIKEITALNGQLYFSAKDNSAGQELWRHDPGSNTTTQVADIRSGSEGSYPQGLITFNGKLYFSARDATTGHELWRHDPDTNTTSLVTDINAGSASSSPVGLTVFNGQLYFNAQDVGAGQELWRHNSTNNTTTRVADINPGQGSSSPTELTVLNEQLYFSAQDASNGFELWRHDPATNSTGMVADINTGTAGSSPLEFTELDGQRYFRAYEPATGFELWRYDPTTNTTSLVADINAGTPSSSPSELTALNGKLYFRAFDLVSGFELWSYDPGTSSTTQLADIRIGSASSSPGELTIISGQIYFRARDAGTGYELWRYDPVSNTTTQVADIRSGSASSYPREFKVFNQQLYFSARNANNGYELWRHNPENNTTTEVANIRPGSASSSPAELTELNGQLYFSAHDGTSGIELWRHNPGNNTTALVADINAGSASSYPAELTALNGQLYFNANNTAEGYELWRYNPGSNIITLVADINAGTASSSPSELIALGGRLYFNAQNATDGFELWRYNLATNSVVMVANLLPGPASSNPDNFLVADAKLLFTANDGISGLEVWQHDPASNTTTRMTDIAPGSGSSLPGAMKLMNTEILLSAADEAVGQEVWTIDSTAPASADAGGPYLAECTGSLTSLSLSGSASGGEGSPLLFTWTGSFGSLTGQNINTDFAVGSEQVTLTVDFDSDSATDIADVTISDTTSPTVSAPADITVEAISATGQAVAIGSATGNDLCSSVSITNDAPAVFSPGTTSVTWTATDGSGNVATAAQQVTLTDTTEPIITAPADVSVSATGALTTVAIGTATATDLFTPITISNDSPAGGFPLGTTVVTWTATDANGNESTDTQSVTVTDATGPSITPPASITAEASALQTSVALGTATAVDIKDGDVPVTNDAPAGGFPLGTTTVTWTAIDSDSNISTVTQLVTITDTTTPVMTVPADMSVSATGPLTSVDIGTATGTDIFTPVTMTNDAPAEGFPVGTTSVTWTATDTNGNSATATQDITVNDTVAPVISAPADITTEATALQTSVALGTATAIDAVNGSVSITNDAPVAGFPLGTTIVTWSATDSSGNTSTATQSVTIVDTTGPIMVAPDDVSVSATGELTIVTIGNATASDIFLPVTVISDAPAEGFPIGTTIVTWTATDANANVSTATQNITVNDTTTEEAVLQTLSIASVGTDWVPVDVIENYTDMVVVCSIVQANNFVPQVTRVRITGSSQFEVKLQSPSNAVLLNERVDCAVAEQGDWLMVNGEKFEARAYVSTVTDENNSWSGLRQNTIHNFSNPVVLGQVMSYNDSNWSSFWSRGAARTEVPSSTDIYTGKMAAEDSNVVRNAETIGFMVFESGSGILNGTAYETVTGSDSIRGWDDTANGDAYTLLGSYGSNAVAIASLAGMDGGNGGWSTIRGPVSGNQLVLSIDEDQIGDAERNHTTEQVSYLVMNEGVSVSLTRESQPPAATATLESVIINAVGESWQPVSLANSYTNPVPVCTTSRTVNALPKVVRVRNVSSAGFEIRLQNPEDATIASEQVFCMVMEEGKWTLPNGINIEAQIHTSSQVSRKNSWSAETQQYLHSYAAPVVIGQVISANNAAWSTFWSQGNSRTAVPSATSFGAGIHTGEDSSARQNETFGYIVIESSSGSIDGTLYEANVGADIVRGPSNSQTGYNYVLQNTYSNPVPVASQVAMDGGDGSWAMISGSSGNSLVLNVDEDQVGDAERSHTTEQVGYFILDGEVTIQIQASN